MIFDRVRLGIASTKLVSMVNIVPLVRHAELGIHFLLFFFLPFPLFDILFGKIRNDQSQRMLTWVGWSDTTPLNLRGVHCMIWCGFRTKPTHKPVSAIFKSIKSIGAVFITVWFYCFSYGFSFQWYISVFNRK